MARPIDDDSRTHQRKRVEFMKAVLIFVGVLSLSVACVSAPIDTPRMWKEAWTAGGFKSPESAAFARNGEAIYVSNVNGYEKNGAGFISRLSPDGAVLDLEWVDGLNAPTGVAVDRDRLWVVDFDRLVEIDIPDRKILGTYPAPDEAPLLNDVAIAEGGAVFVTGSASNTIYYLEDRELKAWIRDDDLLAGANGIHVTDDDIVVAAMHLVRISRLDRRAEILGDTVVLYDLEGVKPDGDGGYYVSAIGDRPLYRLTRDGRIEEVAQGKSFIADFDLRNNALVAPTAPDAVSLFRM
jgi:DNA-binding beta-propeller fold protein YncE